MRAPSYPAVDTIFTDERHKGESNLDSADRSDRARRHQAALGRPTGRSEFTNANKLK